MASKKSAYFFILAFIFFLRETCFSYCCFLALIAQFPSLSGTTCIIPGSFASSLSSLFSFFILIFGLVSSASSFTSLFTLPHHLPFRSHFQPSPDIEPSSLEVSVYLSGQSYLNILTGCIGWVAYNPGCHQTCLSCSIAFLFSVFLLKQSFFGQFYLQIILSQSTNSQASSIHLKSFLTRTLLTLTQPVFLFISI